MKIKYKVTYTDNSSIIIECNNYEIKNNFVIFYNDGYEEAIHSDTIRSIIKVK